MLYMLYRPCSSCRGILGTNFIHHIYRL
jgi:hypothetical protein